MLWNNLSLALLLMVAGMGVVILGLTTLWGCVRLLTAIEERIGRKAHSEVTPATPDENDDAVVVAAAVAAALGPQAVVHHIRLVQDETQEAWARVGRLDIMRSHNPMGSKK